MQQSNQQRRGSDAELAAAEHLEAAGLTLVARNYSCKLGELDLIMRDQKQLVFVEVRYRKSNRFGSPLESITAAKQRKVRAAAQLYLKQIGQQPSVRFDAVGVSPLAEHVHQDTARYKIDWCRNAF